MRFRANGCIGLIGFRANRPNRVLRSFGLGFGVEDTGIRVKGLRNRASCDDLTSPQNGVFVVASGRTRAFLQHS